MLAETETITTGDIVKLWSKFSGKPAEYAEISLNHYDNIWPKWGREIGLMLQFWDAARGNSWTAEGLKILTKEDLKVTGLADMKATLLALIGLLSRQAIHKHTPADTHVFLFG